MLPHRLVPRPVTSKYPLAKLLKTRGTRRAVRIEFSGARPETVINSVYQAVKRAGGRLRYRQDSRGITAWVETR